MMRPRMCAGIGHMADRLSSNPQIFINTDYCGAHVNRKKKGLTGVST